MDVKRSTERLLMALGGLMLTALAFNYLQLWLLAPFTPSCYCFTVYVNRWGEFLPEVVSESLLVVLGIVISVISLRHYARSE